MKLLLWLPFLAYSGLIYYLSSQTITLEGVKVPFLDKFAHFGIYFVWALLCCLALKATWPGLAPGWLLFWVTLGGALYGLSDEIHQSFVPGRESDLLDLLADTLGALVGAWVAATVRARLSRKSRENSQEVE
jgi:VanZ family protein